MSAKLLTKHHLEFLSLKGDCTGSSESRHVKMPHCWKSHVTAHMVDVEAAVHRESYISDHVLLNLFNELGKRDQMRGLPSILSLFSNKFNKFNKTGAGMLDSVYHMTLKILRNFIFGVKTSRVSLILRNVITFPVNLLTTSGLSILMHGVISLSDATSCDKPSSFIVLWLGTLSW